MLILKILGGVAALALGVWLGMPGRYRQTQDELDGALGRPGGRRHKAKRHFTPLGWLRRDARGSERRARGRRRFTTAVAKPKDEAAGEGDGKVAGREEADAPEDDPDAAGAPGEPEDD